MHASQAALVRARDKPIGASPTNLGNMHPTVTTHTRTPASSPPDLPRTLAPRRSTVIFLCPEGRQVWEKGAFHPRRWLLIGLPPFRNALGRVGHRSGVVVRDSLGHSVCCPRRLPQIFPAEYLDLLRLVVRDLLVSVEFICPKLSRIQSR